MVYDAQDKFLAFRVCDCLECGIQDAYAYDLPIIAYDTIAKELIWPGQPENSLWTSCLKYGMKAMLTV